MSEFIKYIFNEYHWLISGPLLTFIALFAIPAYRDVYKNNTDREKWIGYMQADSLKALYAKLMGDRLNWLDRKWSEPETKTEASLAKVAWSYGLLNWALLMAVAYPIVFLIGQWIVTGHGSLNGMDIIPPQTEYMPRILITLWLLCLSFIYLFSIKSKPRWRFPLFIAATVVLIAGAFYFQYDLGAGAVTSAGPVTVAGAVIGAGAVTLAGAGALAAAVALAFTDAGAFAGAVVVVVVVVVSYLYKVKGPRTLHLLIFIVLLLIYITLAIYLAPGLQSNTGRTIPMIIFTAIFPLFNAVADFLSIGLTRYSLRRGLKDFTSKWVLVDFVGGILIFIGLAGSLITYFHFIRPQDHQALLDMPSLLADVRDHPQNYWWLALMTLSTLLPTFIHGCIGMLTAAIQAPTGLRNYVGHKLEEGHNGSRQAGFWAGAVICAMMTVALWVPIALAYWLFSLGHGWMIDNTIGAFQSYSIWLAQTFPF